MISGEQKVRDFQTAEQSSQSAVFVRRPSLGEVARREYHARSRVHPMESVDRLLEVVGSVGHVVQHMSAPSNVEIGNLRDDHTASVDAWRYRALKGSLAADYDRAVCERWRLAVVFFDPVARGKMSAAVVFERGHFGGTAIECDGAARVKPTATRRIDG